MTSIGCGLERYCKENVRIGYASLEADHWHDRRKFIYADANGCPLYSTDCVLCVWCASMISLSFSLERLVMSSSLNLLNGQTALFRGVRRWSCPPAWTPLVVVMQSAEIRSKNYVNDKTCESSSMEN